MTVDLYPEDLGLIIMVGVLCLTIIIMKILNNRRQVIRHVLHGTVTYTIKGYNGVEALRITKALGTDLDAEVKDTGTLDMNKDFR